jgi:hypothetical protein
LGKACLIDGELAAESCVCQRERDESGADTHTLIEGCRPPKILLVRRLAQLGGFFQPAPVTVQYADALILAVRCAGRARNPNRGDRRAAAAGIAAQEGECRARKGLHVETQNGLTQIAATERRGG